uniref:Mediator complex subunit 27 n=1 Tax=Astyanax mexicanus TaxID=7994 RepID=A0A8B9JLU2_ASTMX
MKNKDTLEGREKAFISEFQDHLQSVNRDLTELERLSNLVGRPSESHPLHNSGLLSLDPVQDKTPLYSQLLQAYKWSNKVRDVNEQSAVFLSLQDRMSYISLFIGSEVKF